MAPGRRDEHNKQAAGRCAAPPADGAAFSLQAVSAHAAAPSTRGLKHARPVYALRQEGL
jgi:hypothetical protein